MQNVATDEQIEKFKDILNNHLHFGNAQEIPMHLRLDEIGLDSMSAVNLLLDLEDGFGISFPDSLLNEETFSTGNSLLNAVLTVMSM